MTDLTWTSRTKITGCHGRHLVHEAESKAQPTWAFEVHDRSSGIVAMLRGCVTRDIEMVGRDFGSVVEAKRACQERENQLAERGATCQ